MKPQRLRSALSFATLVTSFAVLIAALSASPLQAQQKERTYRLGADSQRHEGVPKGTVTEHQWLDSKVYPDTKRRYYVYVPAQYDESKPAALMVFQDGHAYVSENGEYRAPVVFDNLIHRGEMPVTIGVFVDPGHQKETLPPQPGWQPQPENRSVEYDSLGDTYSKFLLDEILPEVEKDYSITKDPNGRGICGASSGGICAFTVAWERPDCFGKVISHIGSFTNIRHGDTYPGIIRKTKTKMIPVYVADEDSSQAPTEGDTTTAEPDEGDTADAKTGVKQSDTETAEPKPLRVYLQDGRNDLDNQHGNWPLANQQMFAALKFKNYDVKFDYGDGGHNGKHAGSIFPDALRWLWRDYEGVEPILAIMPNEQTAAWAIQWWMPRHETKLAERKAMKRVDLLMIGDSITHGWEDKGLETWNKYYADRYALNLGFSGDRTEHVIWRFQNGAIDDIKPKLAVIMIGTNNTGHRKEKPEHTAAGIKRVIDELHLRLPGTKVLLLDVFPRGANEEDELRQINTAINEIIKDYASEEANIWFLSIGDKFLDEDGVLPKSIMPDLLHPNASGYEIWAKAMEPMIKQLMGEEVE
jgi:enterochelin esterase-like enzyme/lysophospholipase L1-like esterase